MPTSRTRWLLEPLGLFLVDLGLTSVSMGFYATGFRFDFDVLLVKLLLKEGFDLRLSAFDFLLLVLLRLGLVATGMALAAKGKAVESFGHALNLIATCSISYSLIKVLCFSEVDVQLQYPGVWLNISWNAVASMLLFVEWARVKRKLPLSLRASQNSYQLMDELPSEVRVGNGTVNGQSADVPSTEVPRKSAWEHIKSLSIYCKLHWVWLTVGFSFLLVYSTARIFIPYYVGQIVADIMNQSHGRENQFAHNVIMLCVLSAIAGTFSGLRGGTFTQATALINRSIRKDLFGSIVKQEIGFFDKNPTGSILSRLTTDCQQVSSGLATNVNVTLRHSVMLVGSIVFMVNLSWRLTMITFIAVPPLSLFAKYYGDYYDKLSERTQNAKAESNLVAEEVIGSMRTVRAFACEQREAIRFTEKLDDTLNINKKKAVAYMGYVWMNEFSESLVLIAVLLYAGRLTFKGLIDAGLVASFLFYQMQLMENYTTLNSVFSDLMETVGSSRKVLEYIYRKPTISYDGKVVKPDIEGKVEIQNVDFSYPTRPNSKNLNITINPGETAAFVGPSGAGKSSIISLLEHFYAPAAGRVVLDGLDVHQYEHKHYHQKVALVSQEPVLYSGSIRENILYGCEEWATEQDMVQAARLANAHNFILDFELGYDTKCGEKGVQMSGGQKQRIAIARALVRRPAVLILDEATSALDAESEYVIQKALQQCSVGRTVIVIAHRLSTVEKADRIFVVQKGRVVQAGSHATLMAEDGVYRGLVQRQLLNGSADED